MRETFLKLRQWLLGFGLNGVVAFAIFAPVAVAQHAGGDSPTPGAVASPKAAGTQPMSSPTSDDQYRIGPGDVLGIQVFNRTQLSRDVTVDMRGMITMPLIDRDIQATCRTDKELAEEIARLYREGQFLKNPAVSVSIKDYQSQPVAVMGAVNSPGRFQLRRRVRLLELLVFHAGGPTPKTGGKVQILSTRPSSECDGSNQNDAELGVATYDLKSLLQGSNGVNPYVQQGDIINIPAAEEIIVVGNVLRPGAIPIPEPITLSRAIAMAGGTLPNSKKDKIRITRPSPNSTATTEFLVDMKASDKTQGEGFVLQGGDIVEVSIQSGLKTILRNLATSAVPLLNNSVRVIP